MNGLKTKHLDKSWSILLLAAVALLLARGNAGAEMGGGDLVGASPAAPVVVAGWGANSSGQIDPPPGLEKPAQVAVGYDHVLGLTDGGQVVAWGNAEGGKTSVPSGLKTAKAIAAGFQHSLALTEEGSVIAWGDNEFRQLEVPGPLERVQAIAAGGFHSLALTDDGKVLGWGSGQFGQINVPGNLTNAVAVAAGAFHSLALTDKGEVVAWGFDRANQAPGLRGVAAIASGFNHNLALRGDGTVVAWGFNGSGQCSVPEGLDEVIAIAAGLNHSFALRRDGTVVTWGAASARPIWELSGISVIAAGADFSVVLTSAPFIVAHPESRPLIPGAGVEFAVRVRSSTPVSFQWRHRGEDLPGATAEMLRLNNVGEMDEGEYRVVVRDAHGSVISLPAFLVLAPEIVVEPVSLDVFAGEPARLELQAIGTGPLRFQWLKEGVAIASEGPVLEFPSSRYADAGAYSVVVSNLAGLATSQAAILGVHPRPWVTIQQYSNTITAGDTVEFSSWSAGVSPSGYQWQWNGVDIPGATGPTLFLENIHPFQTGTYRLVASSAGGVVVSEELEIRVLPANPVRLAGRSIRLELPDWLLAAGAIEWRKDGRPIPAATGSVLLFESLEREDSGRYSVRIGSGSETVEYGMAHLTVLSPAWPGEVVGWGATPDGAAFEELTDVIGISAGFSHALVLMGDGTVRGWGYGGERSRYAPPLGRVVAIAAGESHSVALKEDGTLDLFGHCSSCAYPPAGLNNVIGIAAGQHHVVALRNDGTVVSWGSNWQGEREVPPGLQNVVVVAAGQSHSLALTEDGRVVGWGGNELGQLDIPAGMSGVRAIAAGHYHSLALKADGTVASWGANAAGQATVPAGLRNIIGIGAGANHSLAIQEDGTVISWGYGDSGQTEPPPGLAGVSAVTGGYSFSLALKGRSDGPSIVSQPEPARVGIGAGASFSVGASSAAPMSYQWYHNDAALEGATGPTFTLDQVKLSDAGDYSVRVQTHAGTTWSDRARLWALDDPFLFLSDLPAGRVVAWGSNVDGGTDVPADSDIVRISASSSSSLGFAVKRDGTVLRWPGGEHLPKGLTNIVSMTAGVVHTMALQNNGTVLIWKPGEPPAYLEGAEGVQAIAAGGYFCLALTTNGTVLSWRLPQSHEHHLGPEPSTDFWPEPLANIVAIAAGTHHALALREDRRVIQSRGTPLAPIPPPANLEDVSAIAAGYSHSLALKRNGTVVAWGNNDAGQGAVPEGLSDVEAIAAGARHSLALKRNGAIAAWGMHLKSLISPPPYLTNVLAIAGGGVYSMAVQAGPRILSPPAHIVAGLGEEAVFTLRLDPEMETVCQWYWNGNEIAGATSPTLILANVQAENVGEYSVAATLDGYTVWATARLSLGYAPAVVRKPMDVAAYAGSRARFEALVSSEVRLHYQWYFAGEALPGATSPILELELVTSEQAGRYTLRVISELGRPVETSAMLHVLAERPMGTVVAWGEHTHAPPGLSGVVSVAAGSLHSVALLADGTVVNWANDPLGHVAQPEGLSDVLAIAAGRAHTLALRRDGTVAAWGSNSFGESSPPAGLRDVIAVAAAEFHSLALTRDGQVVAWGHPSEAIFVPDDLSDVIAIATAQAHSMALKRDGTVVAWGRKEEGQTPPPPGLSDIIAIAAGHAHSLALRQDGTVAAFGMNHYGQTEVPEGLTDVIAIAAHYGRSLALKRDGTAVAWGLENDELETPPQSLSQVIAISASLSHNLAVIETGSYILSLPQPVTAVLASSAHFEVRALGTGELAYQWFHNDQPIPGATEASYAIAAASFADGGDYAVRVTSSRGSWLSPNVQLRLVLEPSISQVPRDQTAVAGGVALFSVEAEGTGPLRYQWRFEGEDLPGRTTPVLEIKNVSEAHSGEYQVIVSNDYGSVASLPAALIVGLPPEILEHPSSQWAVLGGAVFFRVQTSGDLPLQFQWFHDEQPVPGATGPTLAISGLHEAHAGRYSVQVRNLFGMITSGSARLDVWPRAPRIHSGPTDVTADLGQTIEFSVSASGAGPMSYQWHLDGQALPVADRPELRLENLELDQVGQYSVRVSNAYGSVFSESASVHLAVADIVVDNEQARVLGAWAVASQPMNQFGQNYLFREQGSGSSSVQFVPTILRPGTYRVYEWHPSAIQPADAVPHHTQHQDGTTIVMVNQSFQAGRWNRIGIFTFAAGDSGRVTISDAFPQAGRHAIADAMRWVYVPAPPLIVSLPTDQAVPPGGTARFEVEVESHLPLIYQWKRNGIVVPGASSRALLISNVQAEDEGVYSVTVRNPDGTVQSAPAALSLVREPLSIRVEQGVLSLTWEEPFRLQSSTHVAGPYIDVEDAESPFELEIGFEVQRFFRLK
jgi:alpha-tubulin suppressor-like RCC1 family protein